ncbi:hypothetical protein IM797_17045 [Pedobacter sp. MC2016-24]|nr:hypothetical protein [Pedobacter sp. MC2016-24]
MASVKKNAPEAEISDIS